MTRNQTRARGGGGASLALRVTALLCLCAGVSAQGQVDIDEAAIFPTVGFATATTDVGEDVGNVTVTVELSAPAPANVRVPFSVEGAATDPDDYVISASPLVIPRGSTSADIQISVVDDNLYEAVQNILIRLGRPVGAELTRRRSEHEVAIRETELGDPIEGLTQLQLDAFERGREVFDRRFTPSEGLGPFYNATSCRSCHSSPVSGGASKLYRNFYLAVYYDTTPFNQSSSVPPFLSQVVPAFGSGDDHATTTEFTLEGGRPDLPDTVFGLPVLSAQRNAIPAFGTGLFEFISDATILLKNDPSDSDFDGISGRANTQLSGAALGRFGSKAQVNNIELFTRGPLQNQMGITSDPVDGSGGIVSFAHAAVQVGADPNDPTTDNDGVPDPEISTQDLSDLITFTKFLAPPQRKAFDPSARRGEQLFDDIGCTGCHIPSLPSSLGPVNLYSDLLLHDVGSALADQIRLGDSLFSVNEQRTQPLWGISEVGPYLHDGRAPTLHDAIEAHGGEAQTSRDAYMAMPEAARAHLINFLERL